MFLSPRASWLPKVPSRLNYLMIWAFHLCATLKSMCVLEMCFYFTICVVKNWNMLPRGAADACPIPGDIQDQGWTGLQMSQFIAGQLDSVAFRVPSDSNHSMIVCAIVPEDSEMLGFGCLDLFSCLNTRLIVLENEC